MDEKTEGRKSRENAPLMLSTLDFYLVKVDTRYIAGNTKKIAERPQKSAECKVKTVCESHNAYHYAA
jgi:hypothetical protein